MLVPCKQLAYGNEKPSAYKLGDVRFQDTSCAKDLNAIYDSVGCIGEDLGSVISDLQGMGISSAESDELLLKLRKAQKYLCGIAYRKEPLDSTGSQYCETCTPEDCVITEE